MNPKTTRLEEENFVLGYGSGEELVKCLPCTLGWHAGSNHVPTWRILAGGSEAQRVAANDSAQAGRANGVRDETETRSRPCRKRSCWAPWVTWSIRIKMCAMNSRAVNNNEWQEKPSKRAQRTLLPPTSGPVSLATAGWIPDAAIVMPPKFPSDVPPMPRQRAVSDEVHRKPHYHENGPPAPDRMGSQLQRQAPEARSVVVWGEAPLEQDGDKLSKRRSTLWQSKQEPLCRSLALAVPMP